MNIKKLKKLAESELNRADSGTDECKHYNNGFVDGINFTVRQLNLPNVSQRGEETQTMNLFDERYLHNGIAFTLTESGKLGRHPENKLVLKITIELKKWLMENFEIKKRKRNKKEN